MVEGDGDDRSGQYQILAFVRKHAQGHAHPREDEGKFADLGKTHRNRQCGIEWVAKCQYQQQGGERFANHDDGDHGQYLQWPIGQDGRIEQHAHGDEKQHRKGIAQRQ